MNTILVGLDGSEHSRRALQTAIRIAKPERARLVLLHVNDDRPVTDAERHMLEVEFQRQLKRYSPYLPEFAEGGYMPKYDEVVIPDASVRSALEEAILEEGARQVIEAGLSVTKLSRQGNPGHQIAAAANEIDADMVVIGRRGVNVIQELMLGSVSHKVMHESRTSVLAVA